jgi:hypothetical protein
MNTPKKVPQFVLSNDEIGRITNLEKITPLIKSLETVELCHLLNELKQELYKLISLIIPQVKRIFSEASDAIDIRFVEIYLENFEKKLLWDHVDTADMKEDEQIAVEVGVMLARVTSTELWAYLDQVREAYFTCSEEIIRRHEKNQKIRRIVIASVAAILGLLMIIKSEDVGKLIKFSWEKIHQILSPQE